MSSHADAESISAFTEMVVAAGVSFALKVLFGWTILNAIHGALYQRCLFVDAINGCTAHNTIWHDADGNNDGRDVKALHDSRKLVQSAVGEQTASHIVLLYSSIVINF